MTEEWTPFGFDEQAATEYRVLVDGIPEWLRQPLFKWVFDQISAGYNLVNNQMCLDIKLNTRVDLGAQFTGDYVAVDPVVVRMRQLGDMEFLRVVDYILSRQPRTQRSESALALSEMLSAAGSKWQVGVRGGRLGLVERVPEGVQSSVEGTIQRSGTAGEVLARAWADVHGFQPDASSGYALAVRAVEIAAQPIVSPNNDAATLGSIIGTIRSQGDWRLPLREHQHAPGPDMVIYNLRTLWHGHRDRHGNADYSDVTLDEARAAVALSATLVDWFMSGVLIRRQNVA